MSKTPRLGFIFAGLFLFQGVGQLQLALSPVVVWQVVVGVYMLALSIFGLVASVALYRRQRSEAVARETPRQGASGERFVEVLLAVAYLCFGLGQVMFGLSHVRVWQVAFGGCALAIGIAVLVGNAWGIARRLSKRGRLG